MIYPTHISNSNNELNSAFYNNDCIYTFSVRVHEGKRLIPCPALFVVHQQTGVGNLVEHHLLVVQAQLLVAEPALLRVAAFSTGALAIITRQAWVKCQTLQYLRPNLVVVILQQVTVGDPPLCTILPSQADLRYRQLMKVY